MIHLTYVSPKMDSPRVLLRSGMLPRGYLEAGWIVVYSALSFNTKDLEITASSFRVPCLVAYSWAL